MHGDFSQDPNIRRENYTRVLSQQGRLLVDADWNENVAIMMHYLRTVVQDLSGGWHAGGGVESEAISFTPTGGSAGVLGKTPTGGPLVVTKDASSGDLVISAGNYYVDGVLVELPPESILEMINGPEDPAKNRVVYLDVHERHINSLQSDAISDPAFGGLDTTTRSQLVAKVCVVQTDINHDDAKFDSDEEFRKLEIESAGTTQVLDERSSVSRLPQLVAWTEPGPDPDNICHNDDAGGFRGLENQLYRVEIERGGNFWNGEETTKAGSLTLKWSRDNGSVVYPALFEDSRAVLKTKWRDGSRAIKKDDIVELLDLSGENGVLVKVEKVGEEDGKQVIQFATPDDFVVPEDAQKKRHIFVRRWDHSDRKNFPLNSGGVLVRQSNSTPNESVEISLEDNIKVKLSEPDGAKFKEGDYWIIPARAAIRDLIWPKDANGDSEPRNAQYTQHHYAPIAFVQPDGTVLDKRNSFI